jgi:hypothetical protein
LALYALLLGHCGGNADAELLRRLADRLLKQDAGRVDGVLVGFTLLASREGWGRIRMTLADRTKAFVTRWAALRAARFFYARPEVVARQKVLDAMRLAILDEQLADFPIEYLREWRCWDLTNDILQLYERPTHNQPRIHRAIVCYALQCPHNEAIDFVARLRQTDAKLVREVEEWLSLK